MSNDSGENRETRLSENRLEVAVKLFGVFRNFSEQEEIQFSLPEGATAQDVKKALGEMWPVDVLIAQSVVADETHVLQPEESIQCGVKLAILPPVCGG